ncbi:unnamed protein product, partial [Prorocentrum cordatum]
VSDRLAPTAGALQKTLRIGKALSTRTMHRVRADLAVDLLKELGDDAVEARVRSFRLHRAVPRELLAREALERHVAQAISTKVGEMASRRWRKSHLTDSHGADRTSRARCGPGTTLRALHKAGTVRTRPPRRGPRPAGSARERARGPPRRA